MGGNLFGALVIVVFFDNSTLQVPPGSSCVSIIKGQLHLREPVPALILLACMSACFVASPVTPIHRAPAKFVWFIQHHTITTAIGVLEATLAKRRRSHQGEALKS
jgi:hypothetical protein